MGLKQKLQQKLINFIGNTKIFSKPFFIIFGDGSSGYNINGTDQREIMKKLRPGDIVLRRFENYLASKIVPGKWSHVGIYVGRGNIIHITAHGGIQKEDILNFLRVDNVKVLRCMDRMLIPEALIKAEEQFKKDVGHDFKFDMSEPDTFYCSELIDFCFGGLEIQNPKMKNYILPDDLQNVTIFKTMWEK